MGSEPKFQIRRLTEKDVEAFQSLVHLFNVVFEEEEKIGSEARLLNLLRSRKFIVLAAMIDHEVVGGLTAYELPMYYAEASEIFLYDLAVNPEHQRKGIGKGLLRALKEHCLQNTIQTFFVMAHEEDQHAIEFYRATGGKSENVVNFLYEATQD